MVIYANCVLRASVQAIKELLQHLNAKGCTIDYLHKIITMEERNRLTGADKAYELEKRYHHK
jgi:hypothetical protein